jgi:small-conductance mechanosensitive channel/CRP-like cAMP-binding protein
MIEQLISQFSDITNVFANDRGVHGLLGVILFLFVILVLTRVPNSLRQKSSFWLVEVFAASLILYALSALISSTLSALGVLSEQAGISPIYTVPPILTCAYLFNRAMRLFLWQGFFERRTMAVPRIVWNVLEVIAYVVAVYVILAFVFEQPMTGFIVSSSVVVGVVGLALQPILGDVIAGIGLSIERPFSIGDWIEMEDGSMGEVVNMDWRATEIKTWNNTVLLVPNGKLASATIHNYDRPDGLYGYWFYINIARTVPPDLVRRLLLEAALKSETVLDNPAPVVFVSDSETRPMRYMIYVYCESYRKSFAATDQIMRNAWGLFTKAGFNFAASPQDIEFHRRDPHEASDLEASVLLKEVALLEPLTDEERAKLANEGIHHAFLPGDKITEEEETGDSMFIILSGMVLVQRRVSDGRTLDLARLGTYDYFGEMSLLTGEPRSASVIAYTECQVLEVDKKSLEPLLVRRPDLARQIAEIMAERKLKSELMTAETKKVSVGDRLRDYSEAFTKSIRSFFAQ